MPWIGIGIILVEGASFDGQARLTEKSVALRQRKRHDSSGYQARPDDGPWHMPCATATMHHLPPGMAEPCHTCIGDGNVEDKEFENARSTY